MAEPIQHCKSDGSINYEQGACFMYYGCAFLIANIYFVFRMRYH